MAAPETDFEQAAREQSRGSLAEFWHFIATNKKWWLTPIIVVLLLLSGLLVLGGSGAAPFIYSLF